MHSFYSDQKLVVVKLSRITAVVYAKIKDNDTHFAQLRNTLNI